MSDNSQSGSGRATAAIMAVLLVCCLTLPLGGCSSEPDNELLLTGSFLDEIVTLSVPALPTAEPDLAVGLQRSASSTPSAASGTIATALAPDSNQASSAGMSGSETSFHRIVEVYVTEGESVVAGEKIATLDTGPSDAAVTAAQADLKRAEADLGMLNAQSEEVAQSRSDAASKTAELRSTITDLQSQRTDLQRQLDAARASISPPSLPETATPPANVVAQIAQLETSITQIDDGIEEAQQGITDLTDAQTALVEAEGVLGSIKRTASAIIDGRRAVVNLMMARRDLAVVTAPADGVVTFAAASGEVRAAGAPLVRLRTLARPEVRTYVTAEQAGRIREGSTARVMLDSMPDAEYTGLVTAIGHEYKFVPSTFATRIIHLTRGFEVTVEVYGAPDIPPGTPADLVLHTD